MNYSAIVVQPAVDGKVQVQLRDLGYYAEISAVVDQARKTFQGQLFGILNKETVEMMNGIWMGFAANNARGDVPMVDIWKYIGEGRFIQADSQSYVAVAADFLDKSQNTEYGTMWRKCQQYLKDIHGQEKLTLTVAQAGALIRAGYVDIPA